MTKAKDQGKEPQKSAAKRSGDSESSSKIPAAKASSSRVQAAPEAATSKSSSKIPVAPRASSSKIPVAPRASSSKIPVAPKASSGKIPAASKASSSKLPAAKASGSDDRSSGKMKAARPSKGAVEPEEVGEEGGEEELGEDGQPKRAMGLRGAAPWAARHAAKHAAEARKRAAEPPPPGSARATIRTPTGVEEIKARISDLHNHVERIKTLRKNMNKSFYDIGQILRDIQDQRLFSAKGFQNFESFIEREVDQLGKAMALRLVRMVAQFTREKAMAMGFDGSIEAMIQLEGNESPQAISDSKLPIAKLSMPTSVTRGPIVGR